MPLRSRGSGSTAFILKDRVMRRNWKKIIVVLEGVILGAGIGLFLRKLTFEMTRSDFFALSVLGIGGIIIFSLWCRARMDGRIPRLDNLWRVLIGEEDDCAQLFVGYEDQKLYNDPTACYKILRTWKVIDECQYDPNNGVFDGYWQHVQLIKVNDETAPIFDNCSDEFAVIDGTDGCEGDVTVTRTATDACTPAEDLSYNWTILTQNGMTMNGTGSSFTYKCNGVFPYSCSPSRGRFFTRL